MFTPQHNLPQSAATEANPEAEAFFNLANQQVMEGNFLGALTCFNQAIQLQPNYQEAWYNRGTVLLYSGRIEEALACFDQTIQLQPDLHHAWSNRGVALENLGRIEEALACFKQAIQLNPDYYEAWYNWGIVLVNLGQFEEALTCFNQAIYIKPDYYEAWYNRGIVLANLGRNEEALTCFDQTIQLNPNLHQAWYNWGNTLGILGRIEEALTCFDQAIHIKPDDYKAWHNRGLALANVGRNEEAIISYDRAIYIKPDYHEALFSWGNALKDLGQTEEALACFDQAIHIKPDDYDAWNNRGLALADLGRNEEATRSYDRAIYIKPDYHEAWSNWGIALVNLGRTQEAIASYDQAIRINPDYHVAWNNQAYELAKLGRNEEAIASYDQALEIKPDLHLAWINRGITAGNSISCDPLLAFQSAIAQQNPALNQRGYEGELASHKQGLNHCPQDTHPEGWGLLHQAIGNAHYFRGRRDSSPRPYWHKAIKSYKEALKTLTPEAFPEAHLEVLQKLIRAYSDLGETQKVKVLLGEGTDLLGRLVQQAASDAHKIRLSRKFAGFDQFRVDALAQSGNWCAALELAEQRKNLCLTWLHYGWSESVEDSPNYAQMQQLLQPSPKAPLTVQLSRGQDGQIKITLPKVRGQSVGSKAIIYWHISPAAITTFILRYKQPPLVLSAKTDLIPPTSLPYQGMGENYSPLLAGEGQGERFFYPPSIHQLVEFEDWIETWKKDYQNYRQGARQRNEENRQETQETPVSSSEQERWREEMPERLKKLAEILNIEGILQHLKGVNQLILIPHRDLHLLPLDALFPDKFTITHLPSIKVGLARKKAKQNAVPRQPKVSLLSVDNPLGDLRYASLESELVSKLYPNSKPLSKSEATPTAVKEALSKGAGAFHFTGHSEHDLDQPAQSALILADRSRLTLKDILELDLSGCNLVCLSACETNLTSKLGLIDEFVGLASCFLAAGVMTVIGSLWNVNDLSTAYLMTKFHEILTNPDNLEPPDVATALKKAQNLLRNVTNEGLQQWREQLPLELSQYRTLRIPIKRTDGEMKDNDKPFKSPFYWAAFCAIGL